MSVPRPHRADVAVAAFFALVAIAESTLLPQTGARGLALLFGLLAAAPFLWLRHAPLLVGAAVVLINRVAWELVVVPLGSVSSSMSVPTIFFAVAAYGRRRRIALAALALVVAADTAWYLAAAHYEPDKVDVMTIVLSYGAYMTALALGGTIVGLTLRDRRADVARLRARVEDLEAAIPERASDAAQAEQRRVSTEIRTLLEDLIGRVEGSLAAADRALDSDRERAATLVAGTADSAQDVLEGMRVALTQIRADDADDPRSDSEPAMPATPDELRDALERRGLTVTMRVADGDAVPELAVVTAGRVAAAVDDFFERPPRRAIVRIAGDRLRLELRGGSRGLRRADTSEAALGAVERVRLLGGRLKVRPWAGALVADVPMGAATARQAGPDRRERIARAIRSHPVVAVLLALGVLEQLLHPLEGPLAARLLLALLLPLPLVWRDRSPLLAAVGVGAIYLAGTEVGAFAGPPTQAPLATYVAAFAIGASPLGGRLAALGCAICVAAPSLAMAIDAWPWPLQTYVSTAASVAAAWLVGRLVRGRMAAAAAARAEAALVDQRRHAVEVRAANRERARLAREIHDVVGHAVLVIGMQSGAAQTIARSDPQAAREAIAVARAATGTAANELRRLALLLPGGASDPRPAITQIPELVERLRASGFQVELHLNDAAPVDPEVGEAVYRIVQEALTNAGKHAPGAPVTVELDAGAERVDLRVENPVSDSTRATGAAGEGVGNMRERALACGGGLSAGIDGGQWVVESSFPRVCVQSDEVSARPA